MNRTFGWSLLWACVPVLALSICLSTSALAGSSGSDSVVSDDAVLDRFKAAERALRTGKFSESAAKFESLLEQSNLAQDRRVLALAGLFMSWHLAGDRDQERVAARRFFRPGALAAGPGIGAMSSEAASELRWLRHVALRVVAAADAEQRRNVAASPRNPIPLLAPSEAGETLGWIGCGRDRSGRYLIESESERTVRGVRYSLLSARCDAGRGVRKFWFDLSLWYAFTATHLDGAEPPMGFTKAEAARVVTDEFGRSQP